MTPLSRRMPVAASALFAALVAAAGAQAQGYSYSKPPYAYQPPPYSYAPPAYGYMPPPYVYRAPGYHRQPYRVVDPDYFRAYPYPPSAYGDPREEERRFRRQRYRDPIYNRFGNPRHPTDVWHSAPPYESDPR